VTMRAASLLVALLLSSTTAFQVPATTRVGHLPASGPTLAPMGVVTGSLVPRTSVPAMTVVEEDYRLSAAFVGLGVFLFAAPVVPAAFFTILGLFLAVQTLRIRFVFDDDAFEVKTKPLDDLFSDAPLTNTGDNFAVGGENRWAYSSFVNYEFFPSVDLPVLVYFKEVQTPEDKWDVGPGQWANNDEALAKGAVKGQVHFFPCIAKAGVLEKQFKANGCAKL